MVTTAFAYQNVLNFLVSRFFPNMTAAMRAWGPFALFAACTAAGVVWVYLAFPECKGRSMETMDQLFVRRWWQVGRLQGKGGVGAGVVEEGERGSEEACGKELEKEGGSTHVERV